MNSLRLLILTAVLVAMLMLATRSLAQTPPVDAPYKIVNTAQLMGTGRIDYVSADSDGRRLYVPRGNAVQVFDLDTLKPLTPIVQGRPDGILFEPLTERIYVFSHEAPNATLLDAKDGSIVGTIDLGGSPEQAASDGQGHLYVDLEDKDSIAVVDVKTLKVTATYSLGGTDGGGFNPATREAFSSQRDGTLTIIKENSPTSFAVEQTVQTMMGAKTCTLDTKTNHIVLIATERPAPPLGATNAPPTTASTMPATSTPPAAAPGAVAQMGANAPPVPGPGGPEGRPSGGGPGGWRGGYGGGPAMLHLLVVGR